MLVKVVVGSNVVGNLKAPQSVPPFENYAFTRWGTFNGERDLLSCGPEQTSNLEYN